MSPNPPPFLDTYSKSTVRARQKNDPQDLFSRAGLASIPNNLSPEKPREWCWQPYFERTSTPKITWTSFIATENARGGGNSSTYACGKDSEWRVIRRRYACMPLNTHLAQFPAILEWQEQACGRESVSNTAR